MACHRVRDCQVILRLYFLVALFIQGRDGFDCLSKSKKFLPEKKKGRRRRRNESGGSESLDRILD